MTTVPARVAVVGGGISGLATAFFLRCRLGQSAEIVVYEQRPEIGGHLRVSEVAGVPVDEGAESLLARRPEAVELAEAVGLAGDIVHPAPAGARLWSRGRMTPLPAGTVMGVPTAPVHVRDLLTPAEAEAMSADDSLGGMPIDADLAIGALVAKRYGQAVVDRLVEPLLGGVYAGRAAELSLDATVPALGAAARRHSSLAAAAKSALAAHADGASLAQPVFAGILGGVGRLPAAVAKAAGASIRAGTTVRELRRRRDGWQVVTGPAIRPEVAEADALVLATPAAATAKLLRTAAPAAAAELALMESASVAIVTLAAPRSGFAAPLDMSGFLVPPVDGRVVKAVTFSSVKWPWLAGRAGELVLLRASIGRHGEAAVLQRDDGELVAAVRDDLQEAVGLTAPPVDTRVSRWGGALPQYSVGHVERVARARAAVSHVAGLAICGAAYDGVGVAACVASAGAAAARVAEHLAEGHVRIET